MDGPSLDNALTHAHVWRPLARYILGSHFRPEMESDQSENLWRRMVATKKKGQNEVQEMALGLTKFEWEAGYIKEIGHLRDFFRTKHLSSLF